MRIDVLGTEFDNVTLDEAVEKAERLISDGGRGFVVTPNPEIVMLGRKNKALSSAVKKAFLVLPDGIGVIYGSRILGRPLKGKVAGIEFGETLVRRCAETGKTLYLLGSKPGVAETAAERLCAKYQGLRIVGTADGYFKEDGPVIEKINAVRPDVLFACLGAPKQELWLERNIGLLETHVAVGLGGSLDVFAGVVERAPERWISLGLEWLYRLKKEPRRLGRMMKLPAFLILVVLRRIFHGGR